MSPTGGERTEDDLDSEDARLFRHRLHRFEQLGFLEDEAAELAAADVDWREAGRMIADGCTRQNVLRILL